MIYKKCTNFSVWYTKSVQIWADDIWKVYKFEQMIYEKCTNFSIWYTKSLQFSAYDIGKVYNFQHMIYEKCTNFSLWYDIQKVYKFQHMIYEKCTNFSVWYTKSVQISAYDIRKAYNFQHMIYKKCTVYTFRISSAKIFKPHCQIQVWVPSASQLGLLVNIPFVGLQLKKGFKKVFLDKIHWPWQQRCSIPCSSSPCWKSRWLSPVLSAMSAVGDLVCGPSAPLWIPVIYVKSCRLLLRYKT